MTHIIIGALVSFFVSIALTPVLIRKFSEEGLGQEIREEGPQSHLRKRGTPTMGGIAVITGILVGYLVAGLSGLAAGAPVFTASGFLVLFLTLASGSLGFADDFIKLFKERNLGLNKKAKLIGQFVIALAFGILILLFPNSKGVTPGSTHLSYLRDFEGIDLALGGSVVGMILFALFIYILVAGWSNAVNLTDGLDGLAAGATALTMAGYTAITWWQFANSCERSASPGCYAVRDPLDLAILTAAALGACLGFLWWNAAPAKIFMGDTGSLALGGLVAAVSVVSRTELLMFILGALFFAEAVTVIIQVVAFRTTGKRPFRMAPFHHHFENGGWAETTVVVRFWILAAVSAFVGVAVFYGEWLSTHGGL